MVNTEWSHWRFMTNGLYYISTSYRTRCNIFASSFTLTLLSEVLFNDVGCVQCSLGWNGVAWGSDLERAPPPYIRTMPTPKHARFLTSGALIAIIVNPSEAVKWKMYLPDQRQTRKGCVKEEEVINGWKWKVGYGTWLFWLINDGTCHWWWWSPFGFAAFNCSRFDSISSFLSSHLYSAIVGRFLSALSVYLSLSLFICLCL